MKRLTFCFLFIIHLLVFQSQAQTKHDERPIEATYLNPIIPKYLADPFIKYNKGYYYFFATGEAQDGRYISIYRSKDLSKWDFVRGAVANGGKQDWNYKHFWAPEVMKIKNKYYLYYTASPENSPANSGNRVGVAVADKIEGPYKNIGVVIPNASIDGHPVKDKDGNLYIFYTIEWQNSKGFQAGHIYVDKMLSPTQVADQPKQIISHHNWQEGAFILQRDRKYFLTYSCGAWSDSTYHVRYAISNNMTGPYQEQQDTIIKSNAFVKGPGHHSLFQDKKGNDWMVYHGWDTAFKARYPRIDPIRYNNGKITTRGPSFSPQLVSGKEKEAK
jgi:beta-xylosidase